MQSDDGAKPIRVVPTAWIVVSAVVRSTTSTTSGLQGKNIRHLPPLQLSSQSFTAFWVLLLALHALHATFLIACAHLYWYVEHPYLSYYADLLAPPNERHFKTFGTILGLIGAYNAAECFGLLYASVRARQPAVLRASNASVTFKTLMILRSRWKPWQQQSIHPSLSMPPTSRMDQPFEQSRGQVQAMIQRGIDLFSVHSSYFGAVYTMREVVEIGAQVAQCYKFSVLIARPWINHTSVALVALNCASTALFYPLLRRWEVISYHMIGASRTLQTGQTVPPSTKTSSPSSPACARLLCVLTDCLLNVGTSILLPVIVFAPYARQYDPEMFTFQLTLLYSDTEFPNLVRENQALFARSMVDIVYKLVPHLSILFCLLVIASLLRNAQIIVHLPHASVPRPIAEPTASRSTTSGQISYQHSFFRRHTSQRKREKPTPALRLKRLVVTAAFLGVGLTIVSLHLCAVMLHSSRSHRDHNAASICKQPVYPWFASGDSCTVIEFNCYRLGVDTPPTNAFDNLDPSTVSSVIFTHCPALVVPPIIQSFSNLIGLELYNCTVVEWSAEAAITNDHHPDMIFLSFAYVNMAELPPGVLQTPFPGKLGDIELSKTNLTALPSSLPDVWGSVELVYLEYSLFTEVPRELLSISALSELSLIGNKITHLPDDFSDLIETNDFYFLALASNPITSLPPTLRSGLSFGFLSLESTGISELPDWVDKRVYEGLYLYDTPLCSSSAAESDSTVKVGCSARNGRADGRYPLSIKASILSL